MVRSEPHTIHLTDRLSVRLYPDCRPNCLETARLQKGLVLMLDGAELIEEGVGFGVPVVKYADKTYFASSARVTCEETSSGVQKLTKTYLLDTVSRKKLSSGRYIDDGFYSFMRKRFAKFYLKNKNLSPLFNKLMELRDVARVQTEFVRVKPRGSVAVAYECSPSGVAVRADFSGLRLGSCEEILVLNEQGSNTFQMYTDASGLTLACNRIGAWDAVAVNEAALLSPSGHFSFSLHSVGDAALFRGWERTKNRFSWAGLSYSLPPNRGSFAYMIGLKC